MKLTRWRIADHVRKRNPREVGMEAAGPKDLEEFQDPAFAPEEYWETEWEKNLLAVLINCSWITGSVSGPNSGAM